VTHNPIQPLPILAVLARARHYLREESAGVAVGEDGVVVVGDLVGVDGVVGFAEGAFEHGAFDWFGGEHCVVWVVDGGVKGGGEGGGWFLGCLLMGGLLLRGEGAGCRRSWVFSDTRKSCGGRLI